MPKMELATAVARVIDVASNNIECKKGLRVVSEPFDGFYIWLRGPESTETCNFQTDRMPLK